MGTEKSVKAKSGKYSGLSKVLIPMSNNARQIQGHITRDIHDITRNV